MIFAIKFTQELRNRFPVFLAITLVLYFCSQAVDIREAKWAENDACQTVTVINDHARTACSFYTAVI